MLYYDFRGIPEEMFVPLYEYLCPKCGHRFENIEKVGAPEKKKCPKCGAKAERTIAASAFQFKGAGWYVTDYGGKSGGSDKSDKAEKSDSSDKNAKSDKSEKSDGKKTETSTESSKPAPAKESSTKKKDKD
ncbi:MAG TPA: zinc ribbon domain-containing protein [Candidatus Acidoferrales bacterium]|nr:zinc ribbon domain-containing protein [Candidatus Acidoferrales bacterium]